MSKKRYIIKKFNNLRNQFYLYDLIKIKSFILILLNIEFCLKPIVSFIYIINDLLNQLLYYLDLIFCWTWNGTEVKIEIMLLIMVLVNFLITSLFPSAFTPIWLYWFGYLHFYLVRHKRIKSHLHGIEFFFFYPLLPIVLCTLSEILEFMYFADSKWYTSFYIKLKKLFILKILS